MTKTYDNFIKALKELTDEDIVMLSDFSSFSDEGMFSRDVYDAVEDRVDLANVPRKDLDENFCLKNQEYYCGFSFRTVLLDLYYTYEEYPEFKEYKISERENK